MLLCRHITSTITINFLVFQCKWEKFRHLPDIRPLATREFERQVTTMADTQTMYQDADANFSQNRVEEILKSEGFLSPDSGLGLNQSSEPSASPHNHLSSIVFDVEFLKTQNLPSSRGYNSRRSERQMFNIQSSRVEPQIKPGITQLKKSTPTNSGESLAILHATKRRLPSLTTHAIGSPGQSGNNK